MDRWPLHGQSWPSWVLVGRDYISRAVKAVPTKQCYGAIGLTSRHESNRRLVRLINTPVDVLVELVIDTSHHELR